MEESKINSFFAAYGDKLPAEKSVVIREKLQQVDDSRYATISCVQFKNPTTILVVSIFFGWLGIDRFMLGDTGMGILKLCTGGLCGIPGLIDLFTVSKKAKEVNFNELMKIL